MTTNLEYRVHRLWIMVALVLLAVIRSGIAAADLSSVKTFDIPAQSVPSALLKFSSQSGVQVTSSGEILEGKESGGVIGTFAARTALDKLLQGTELHYDVIDANTIAIRGGDAGKRSAAQTASAQAPASFGQKAKKAARSFSDSFRTAQADQGPAQSSSTVGSGNQSFGSSQNNEPMLTEITVTAQRREESIDKVPISMTAFPQTTLDDLHIQSFSDLAATVPGLVITTSGSNVQSQSDVLIRGISSGGNAPTTGIYIDETPIVTRQNGAIAYSGSPQPDIFDLERVEVLRGPQGTLFGAGAMGGAIRYITPAPSLESSSGYSKVEFSYTDGGAPSYSAGVAYGAPIVEDAAGFRVSGWFHSDGGFIDVEDPYTGRTLTRNANSAMSYVLRPAFTLVPTEGLTITPAVFFQHHESDEPDQYWRTDLPNPDPGSAFATGFGNNVRQPVTDNVTVGSVAVKYVTSGLSLQSDTSYMDRNYKDFDDWSNTLPPLFGVAPLDPALSKFASYDEDVEWTRAWQQEFRLSSTDPSARVRWVGGLYYRHSLDGVSQFIAPDLTPVTEAAYGLTSLEAFGIADYLENGDAYNSYTWARAVTEQKALFGELNFAILPKVRINAGVRIERVAVEEQQQVIAGPLNGTTYTAFALPDEVQTPVTPRGGITYQFTDADMVYATVAKGYRAGGSNSPAAIDNPMCGSSAATLGLSEVPATFSSDSLWSYEIGTKDSFLEHRVTLEFSAYSIDWKNIQTNTYLPSCGEAFTANRGRVVSQGLDLQFAAILAKGLTVSGTVGYDNAYHPDAIFGAPTNGTTPLIFGAGDKLAGVPPWTAAVHLEYSRDIGPLWSDASSYIRIDYRWIDDDPKGDPRVANYDPELMAVPAYDTYPNQAYGTLNLRLGVEHEGLDLSAFVENATNAEPLLALDHSVPGDPLFTATALRPLTAGVTAIFRF